MNSHQRRLAKRIRVRIEARIKEMGLSIEGRDDDALARWTLSAEFAKMLRPLPANILRICRRGARKQLGDGFSDGKTETRAQYLRRKYQMEGINMAAQQSSNP